MTLNDLADRVSIPATSPHDWTLRVILTNFVRGIEAHHNIDGFVHRLKHWLESPSVTAAAPSPDQLHTALFDTLENHKGDSFFLRTGRTVQTDLNLPAVTFSTEAALQFWLDVPNSDYENNPPKVRALCGKLNRREYLPGVAMGKPRDVVWLTPARAEILALIDQAKALTAAGIDADESKFSDVANKARNRLGLSQYGPPISVIALITKKTIGELLDTASHPTANPDMMIMGPSVIEGRCHPRWRHWLDDFGRTFELDMLRRTPWDASCGFPEAVRCPISLDDISEFVFLGSVSENYIGRDEDFARAIGADASVEDTLRRLHRLTGI